MTPRIIVIGGGIAGLAAAHRIIELKNEKHLDFEVTLLEASSRLGGSIATERVGDFLVEGGPDSFITEKPWALKLCERLNLVPRLVSTQAAYQKIYVVHNGKLEPLPEGFFLLAPTRLWPFIKTPIFSWAGKLRMAGELLLRRRDSSADESLGSFVRRRFGAEALERIAQPLVGGIYASDPEKLSLSATMPRFLDMERAQRSVIYAMWSAQRKRARQREAGSGARWSLFVTLAGGMQELVDAIHRRLPEGCVRLNARVVYLHRDDNQLSWHATLEGQESLHADAIILATPAYRTAEIIEPLASSAANELQQISYASTATVSLAYRRADFPHVPDSFGFVVPAIEGRKIIACTFSSLKYPNRAPADKILLRAFIGGSLQPEQSNDDDATLIENVRHEIASLLGVNAKPLFSRIWRYPNSMPQYHVGHMDRVKRIEAALGQFSTLALAGSAYHGVGISDCVRTGEEAAQRILAQVEGSKQ
ncbi:MAG: protoporphyrinogen oxidase [Deltaproteobacteria bacterium]|nr:protoporphyrinogen oxidase [Deltaproteobacteria bacterium]